MLLSDLWLGFGEDSKKLEEDIFYPGELWANPIRKWTDHWSDPGSKADENFGERNSKPGEKRMHQGHKWQQK